MRWLRLTAALLLAGCGFTPEGNLVRDTVKQAGAQAFDEGLANAEWFICNAATIGAIRRRYGKSEDMAQTYRRLCEGAGDTRLFEPERKS